MTAEDPVEFNLAGINQVQINDQVGLTFAATLRSFLRQDPNIILVGEIRDLETAEIADLIEDYRRATDNARRAGFDGARPGLRAPSPASRRLATIGWR